MPYIGRGSDFGVRSRFIYTATAGQTTFSGNDDAGISLAYTDTLYMDVYQNGVLLVPATDYAASTGTSVVLVQGASVDDTLELLVHDIFSVADSVSAKDGGTFSGTIAAAGLSTSSLGTSNFRAGVNAGNSIEAGGNYNTVVGDEAGTAITTGDGNTAVGYQALDANTTASNNTAMGYNAGAAVTTGVDNTFIGGLAGDATTDADGNVAVGKSALSGNVLGGASVAIGKNALAAQNPASATSMLNTAVGANAGLSVTTGIQNTLIGGLAGDALTDSDYNTAVGYQALSADTLGGRSTAIGYQTLATQNFTSATNAYNTAVGYSAGVAVTTGANNTVVGSLAGDAITTGSNNTFVGYNIATSAVGNDNQIGIGANFGLGGANQARIGIGSNHVTIDLNGSDTSWAAASDERLKENITTSTAGLSFIKDLRPVTFNWKKKKDVPSDITTYYEEGSDERCIGFGKTHHGFIAQEVKTVLDNHSEVKDGQHLWNKNNDDTQAIAPAALVPMLVKAIQELSAKNDALEARITALEA